MPVGAIAGPVVAVMVVLSIAVFWWLRKKKVTMTLLLDPSTQHRY